MPYRVLTPDSHGDETMQIAYDMIPEGLELVTAPHGRPEFWNLLKDADFYIGAGQFKHGPEFYAQAPKLKLVQTLSAGYNTYDLEAARAAGVPICNNGGANATAVAEHAIMLMLAVSRKLIWVHEGVTSGRWRGNDFNQAKLYEREARHSASSDSAISAPRLHAAPRPSTCGSIITTSTACRRRRK